MDRYPKLFILLSLIYFGVGAILGLTMGVLGHESLRFAHVHLNLLGFMSMMIYGVGYFILPRFNGTTLKWPQWVGPQFWLANVGLLGMIISNYSYYSNANQVARVFFGLFASLEALAIVMFVLNLAATLAFLPKAVLETNSESGDQAESSEGTCQEPAQDKLGQTASIQGTEQIPAISPDMPVGEIVEKWESTIPVLVEAGFQHLANPEARQMVKRVGVTLRAACERHGLDLEQIVAELEETIKRENASSKKEQANISKNITAHEIIGDVLKRYPSTREVFRKYYGEGCFTCPGQSMESVAQSAMMHNVPLEKLLNELNSEAEHDTREKAAV